MSHCPKSRCGVWVALVGLIAGVSLTTAPGAMVVAAIDDDFAPTQSSLDGFGSAPNNGLWGDAPGGLSGRPYVKALKVVNGTNEHVLIDGTGTVSTAQDMTEGTPWLAISPVNLCRTGQAPAQNVCYASPNRLAVQLVYAKDSGAGWNFSNPDRSDGTTPVSLPVTINADTVIEAVINMNTWGDKLRWTWMNGEPTYWKVDDLGSPDAEITVRFRPVVAPSMMCTSAIPVMACDPATAPTTPYEPIPALKGEFVLSLDSTGVPASFSGTLFASSRADIGSLDVSEAPASPLSYGIIGPSEMNGAANTARFSAFVSDVSLLNHFGGTGDVVGTTEFRDAALAVTRTDGGSGGTPTWTRWSAATNGTDGWFLDITGIRFNGSAVSGSGVVGTAQTKTQPARIRVRPVSGLTVSSRRKGTSVTLAVRATAAACARSACRVVIRRLGGDHSTMSTPLKTVNLGRKSRTVSLSTSIRLPVVQRISIQLQVKRNGVWTYVGSTTRRP